MTNSRTDILKMVNRDLQGWNDDDVVHYITDLLLILSGKDKSIEDGIANDIKEMYEMEEEDA